MTVNTIIHRPNDIQAQQELARKVATVHAQTVFEMVRAMPYPPEKKAQLIDALKKLAEKAPTV